MHIIFLAETGRPLFGSMWLASLVVAAAIAFLLVAVALVGRWLAATHPDPVPVMAPPTPPDSRLSPEILAIIACAVNVTLGSRTQITAVSLSTAHAPSVEALMLQWSLEGRRQIYTSHKVR